MKRGLVQRVEQDLVQAERRVVRAAGRSKVPCPHCGQPVSSNARSCPSCRAILKS